MVNVRVLPALLALLVVFAASAFGQDVANPGTSGWNPNAKPPEGFVSAHTFYWLLGVGTAIVTSLTTVIGILWAKLNAKQEDERKDVLARMTSLDTAFTAKLSTLESDVKKISDDLILEKNELRADLKETQAKVDTLHEKTLKIAVRAQQGLEAMANITIGTNITDDSGKHGRQ